ncbi:LamG domain-containing protein [Catelliglobosispora koreensis]|uniref:LamG domain-containing protein n=1 Tax=Catelliglobosispora koreensis TaxID=129052 RepID=UPI0003A48F8D|nr:LamG domain-containing protein [Catelliglobosispora koreensis]
MKRIATAVLMSGFLIVVNSAEAQAAPACAPSALSEAAAVRLAAQCKSKVEVAGLRDGHQQVFANPDGTQTLISYAVPQRVRKDGTWRDIDLKLQRGSDGRLWPAVAADVSFSGGGDSLLVSTLVEGKRFSLSWPHGTLPAPTVNGAIATYAEVLPGADLAVEATRTGYRQVLVVKTAAAAANPAVAKVRYKISGDVTARNTTAGELELVDSKGKVLPFGSHASMMWDSALDPAVGGEVLPGVVFDPARAPKSTVSEPSELAHVRRISVTAQDNSLTVVADAELLRTGTLPIFIDPPWDEAKVGWAYATNDNANWTPGEHARVGDNPDDTRLFRSYFSLPITGLHGKQVISGSFHAVLDHNAACAGNTAHAYRVGDIGTPNGSRIAWSTGLGVKLGSAFGDVNETGSCGSVPPDVTLIFGNNTTFRDDLQGAANASAGRYSVGLCMCDDAAGNGETGTYEWMKFLNSSGRIVATYNSYPGTPANLTTSTLACGATVGTTSPTLKAQYVDADGSDTLTGYFEWKDNAVGPVTPVTGPARPAGDYGDITLSLGAGAEGKTYSWRVQTRDGIAPNPSAWSGWCNFTVNASPPPQSGVTSPVYLADGVAHGGPGISADFILSNGGSTGQDVTSYTYGWTDPPSTVVNVSAGASATVKLTPPRYGSNTLHVFSKDAAGTPGPTKHYSFLVQAPSAPIAHWPLDQINAPGFNNTVGSAHMTVESGNTDVVWTPDLRYIGSPSANFNSVTETTTATNGVLTAAGAGLDTSGSFSVAAWVRPQSPGGCANVIALSVDASSNSGFTLGHDCWANRWRVGLHDINGGGSTLTFAASTSVPQQGKWTHLAAAWDEAESKLKLYVNGTLEADVTPSAQWLANRAGGWASTGPVVIGRSKAYGTPGSYFTGSVAEVRLWNRVAVAEDITGLINTPVQVASYDFADGSNCFCGDALDGSYWSRHLTLSGWETGASGFATPGHDGNDALQLNGTSGHAYTAGPVLRTDQSFTVSAWVKVNAVNGTDQVVMMQGGWPWWAMTMGISGSSNKWVFGVSTENGSGGFTWGWAESNVAAVPNTWVHLTGVFNQATGETRLYLNGTEQTVKGTGAKGWNAVSSLHVGSIWGNAALFGGQIDQIKAYAGAMTPAQVTSLYNS